MIRNPDQKALPFTLHQREKPAVAECERFTQPEQTLAPANRHAAKQPARRAEDLRQPRAAARLALLRLPWARPAMLSSPSHRALLRDFRNANGQPPPKNLKFRPADQPPVHNDRNVRSVRFGCFQNRAALESQ